MSRQPIAYLRLVCAEGGLLAELPLMKSAREECAMLLLEALVAHASRVDRGSGQLQIRVDMFYR